MRSPFLWRLTFGCVALILLSTTIVGGLISRRIERDSLAEIRGSLEERAFLLKQSAGESLDGPSEPSLQERVKALGSSTGARFTVLGPDGEVIADSEEDPSAMDNHANRPEVLAARSQGRGVATGAGDASGARWMHFALAVERDDRLLGFIRTSLPLSALDERIAHLRRVVVLGAGLAILAALPVCFFLSRRLTAPLASMTTVAESMARGDYGQRLPILPKDEIGRLAQALNGLAESWRDRMETIATDHNKLLTILAGMEEGLIAVDGRHRLVHMNASAGRILRVSPEESLGKEMREIIRVPEVCETLDRTLRDRAEIRGEFRLVARPRDHVVAMHASPLRNGDWDLVGAMVVLSDVSELHRLATVRRDFVANVSHELKTPITAIRGLVETLIDDTEMTAENRGRFLPKIRDQAMRLSSIVTDLLTISRLESESTVVERSPIDLRESVLGAVRPLLSPSEARGISVEIQLSEEPVGVLGDDEALRQATSNLLDNAIKYTPEGGRVWVRLRSVGGKAIIEVQDTGIGIEARDQSRIFERFYRVDKARSRELGGTGLGLSIVKHIALSHQGEVSVDSVPGAGSTFRVMIPLAEPSA